MDMLKIVDDLDRFVGLLRVAVSKDDSLNIVRSCSLIGYCVSDLLETALPDGVSIIIKK